MTAVVANGLDRLEQLAENATPGPWTMLEAIEVEDGDDNCYGIRLGEDDYIETDGGFYGPYARNAAFIAAADPQVVAALVKVAKAAIALRNRRDKMPLVRDEDRFDAALADLDARLYAANDPGHPQQGEG